LVLRFHRHDQEYKVPGNVTVGGREWPVGLALTTGVLFLVAIGNLFSKKVATIYGVAFTVLLFIVFTVSVKINTRKNKDKKGGLEEFNLDIRSDIDANSITAREGCILVA